MIDNIMQANDVQQLIKALLCLRTEEEAAQLLTDICTMGELRSLAQRLEVAGLLRSGYTYNQVEEMTGASTATISRIKRFLQYGSGGYELILQRMGQISPKTLADGDETSRRN